MRIPAFNFDQISFWLGFLAATLLWWLVSRIRPWIPQLKRFVQERIEEERERAREGVGIYFRQSALKRAQGSHLAARMFSLDEILIEPRLLVPPSFLRGDASQAQETIAGRLVPYLPDWPELASPFGVPTLTLAETLEKGVNIAVIGQPGVGKTVALAHLASQIARRSPDVKSIGDFVPVFTHALDFDFTIPEGKDPIENLVRVASHLVPALVSPRLSRFFLETLEIGKILLIVDGLDELPDAELIKAVQFFGIVLKKYPKFRFVTANNPDFIGGLAALGVLPLSLSTWSMQDRNHFVELWTELWSANILPGLKNKTEFKEVDSQLIFNWLKDAPQLSTPLEFTLKVWSSFSGDMLGPSPINNLEAFIQRLGGEIVPRQALEGLAYEYFRGGKLFFTFSQIERYLTKFKLPDVNPSVEEKTGSAIHLGNFLRPVKKDRKITSSGSAIERLLVAGILVEHVNEQIRFVHPVLCGFLASKADASDLHEKATDQNWWVIQQLLFKYLTAVNKATEWVEFFVNSDQAPLYRKLFMVARWLSYAPENTPWRTNVMRQMINMLHDEREPLDIRARVMAAFLCSNDPSIPLLLKQLLTAESSPVRLLAALGSGSYGDPKLINDLLNLYADGSPEIRNIACLAIGAIGGKTAMETLVGTLMQGDDELRQSAAEMIATKPGGDDILRTAAGSRDLLTRRASIMGLAQIRADWTMILMEKIAVEDGQWVVRNVAGQVLEALRGPNPIIPAPLPPPHEASWLIAFASKQGAGISASQPVTEMLLSALRNGSLEEKLAALAYLKLTPDPEAIQNIYACLHLEDGRLSDAGLYALWFLGIAGAQLAPPPRGY